MEEFFLLRTRMSVEIIKKLTLVEIALEENSKWKILETGIPYFH